MASLNPVSGIWLIPILLVRPQHMGSLVVAVSIPFPVSCSFRWWFESAEEAMQLVVSIPFPVSGSFRLAKELMLSFTLDERVSIPFPVSGSFRLWRAWSVGPYKVSIPFPVSGSFRYGGVMEGNQAAM